MENQIMLSMDDNNEHKFVEPDLDAINGEVPDEEEEEEEVDEYHQRQYQQQQGGGGGGVDASSELDRKVDSAGYHNVEQSTGRDASEGKLFVGGISWETTEESFSNYFRKYGEIADSVIMMDKITGRPRGFGFVTFADPVDADKVLEKEHNIDGRVVEVKRTVPREDMQQQQQVSKAVTKTKKIFVGGIPPSFTEDEMKEYFSSYGSIIEHQIMLDHSTGRSRGFGFVTFETEDAVDRVFLDGQRHELGGKQVEIKRAEPKRSEGGPQKTSYTSGGGYRSSGAGYGGRSSSRGGYGGAKDRGYGGSGGYDGYDSYDQYSGNYGGAAAGFYGAYGPGAYGYGFGGSMYGTPGAYPGYGVVPGYGGAGRGYVGVGGYGAGRGYGGSEGGYGGGRGGYGGGVESGYGGGGRGYGGAAESGYNTGRGYGGTEGDYGNSRGGGYDSARASSGGSRGGGGSGGYGSSGSGRGSSYGSSGGNGGTGSTRYHPYQRQ